MGTVFWIIPVYSLELQGPLIFHEGCRRLRVRETFEDALLLTFKMLKKP